MATLRSNLNDQLDAIKTRKDFVTFVHELLHNLQSTPGEWENRSLESYLEAFAAWVEDCEGFYANRDEKFPEDPSWKFLGEALLAARIYE
jgi:hypothetical protein